MTFYIDKDGKSVNRVDDNRHQWLPHLDICEKDKDLSDPYAGGYRPAVAPIPRLTADEWKKQLDKVYHPVVHVDLSQCSNRRCQLCGRICTFAEACSCDLRIRREAIAAHKHAIATAETDAYAKPVSIRGIDWSVWTFIAAMAMLGICIALGVAMVMS